MLTEERKTTLQEDIEEFKKLLTEMYYGEFEYGDEAYFDTDEIIEWYEGLNKDEKYYVWKIDRAFIDDVEDMIEAKKEQELSL